MPATVPAAPAGSAGAPAPACRGWHRERCLSRHPRSAPRRPTDGRDRASRRCAGEGATNGDGIADPRGDRTAVRGLHLRPPSAGDDPEGGSGGGLAAGGPHRGPERPLPEEGGRGARRFTGRDRRRKEPCPTRRNRRCSRLGRPCGEPPVGVPSTQTPNIRHGRCIVFVGPDRADRPSDRALAGEPSPLAEGRSYGTRVVAGREPGAPARGRRSRARACCPCAAVVRAASIRAPRNSGRPPGSPDRRMTAAALATIRSPTAASTGLGQLPGESSRSSGQSSEAGSAFVAGTGSSWRARECGAGRDGIAASLRDWKRLRAPHLQPLAVLGDPVARPHATGRRVRRRAQPKLKLPVAPQVRAGDERPVRPHREAGQGLTRASAERDPQRRTSRGRSIPADLRASEAPWDPLMSAFERSSCRPATILKASEAPSGHCVGAIRAEPAEGGITASRGLRPTRRGDGGGSAARLLSLGPRGSRASGRGGARSVARRRSCRRRSAAAPGSRSPS